MLFRKRTASMIFFADFETYNFCVVTFVLTGARQSTAHVSDKTHSFRTSSVVGDHGVLFEGLNM